MFDFRKLLKLLEKELNYQEQLLKLLARERTAIVKLQQAEIEAITQEKSKLLAQALDVEKTRQEIFSVLQKEKGSETPISFGEVLSMCPPGEGRGPLTVTGERLKKVASSVKELNDENASLMKHSLGLIASTISIMTAAPDTDLPTYNSGGKLQAEVDESTATLTRRPVVRQA